jgi:cell division protease FtsH
MGQEYSDETALKIDIEIRRVVDEAYETAKRILNEHRDALDQISLLLIEKETVDREQFEAILRGDDPEEVFRVADEAKARKAAETTRARKQRQREQEGPVPEGLAPGSVATFAAHFED